MNKNLFKIIIILIGFVLIAIHSRAYSVSKQVQLNLKFEVKNLSKLELNTTAITFDVGSLSPDEAPIISSPSSPISVIFKARTGRSNKVTLTILPADDLVSGPDIISISNISWITTGPGFIEGTMNKTAAQPVGTWTGSGVRSGTITFRLINRWEYARGEYGTTALFILTAP